MEQNIPVTAGTLLVLAIQRDGGPLPVVVKPCTVISNSVSAVRFVARYFSLLTVALTLYLSFPIIDSFKYKTDFQVATDFLSVYLFIGQVRSGGRRGAPASFENSDKTLYDSGS